MVINRPAEKVIPREDPIIKEMTDVLRAWGDIWKKVYVVCGQDVGRGGARDCAFYLGRKYSAISGSYKVNARHLGLEKTNFVTNIT